MADKLEVGETPIIVSPSSVGAQLAAALRIVTILIGGFTTLLSFLKTSDLLSLYSWLHSTEGAGFVAAVVTVVTFATSLYKTRLKQKIMVTLATFTPDSIGQVKK